jgi:DNA-binding beta-propeller fold protein YncE
MSRFPVLSPRSRRLWPLALLAAAVGVPTAAAHAHPVVYVASTVGNELFQYGADDVGLLSPLAPPTIPAGERPPDVTVSADGESVYATGRTGVSQFDVGDDGTLSPKLTPTVAAGAGPTSVVVSPDNRSAYVGNVLSGAISQYTVGPLGALFPKSTPTVPLDPTSQILLGDVAISPDGKSVYATGVPSGDPTGPGAIYQYDVQVGGLLSPKTPAQVPAGTAPAGLAVHPAGTSVYVLNPVNDTISEYDVKTGGTLSPGSSGPMGAGDVPAQMALSPDGMSAYVANFGDQGVGGGSVTQYDVGAGGSLQPKRPGLVLAGANPSAVAVSPDGQSVYVTDSGTVGAGNGTLYQFDVGLRAALVPKAPPSLPLGAGATANAVVVGPVLATPGADVLTGTAADNVICGLGGSDTIRGLGGDDVLHGDSCKAKAAAAGAAARRRAGKDVLIGGAGRDRLEGGRGRDRLRGGAGHDRLHGGEGRDRLDGGRGNDAFDVRDGGRDDVECGDGRDTIRAEARDTVRHCERIIRSRS